MKENQNIKKVLQDIHDVLIRVWDPIGVSQEEAAQDEYDSYIGAIYSLLQKKADSAQLERHLRIIEEVNMGLSCSKNRREAAVKALLNIKIS